jgi:predicted PurR-regulated permease PerM
MNATRQLRIWGISLLVFILLLYVLRGVLTPFVAGMAVAYFVDPLADRLEKWGLSRSLATTVITISFFVVAIGAISTLLPILTAQLIGFAGRVPTYFEELRAFIEPLLRQGFANISDEHLKQIGATAAGFTNQALSVLTNLLKSLLNGGATVINVISILVLTPLVTFYLLRDWDLLVARIDSWLPRKLAPVIRTQFSLIDANLAGFVRGQASVCLVLGTFYAIGLSIVGLEFGLLVGLGAGFISFIPYVGAMIGLGVGFSIALVQFSEWMPIAIVVGIFLTGQTAESYFLTPKLVGERIGLHPVWLIFALMAGGSLAGFTGVLLAVPIAAIIGVLIRFALAEYLKSALYSGNSSDHL